MRTSSDVTLRLLTPDDLDETLVLSSTAGWNQRREDWRMLLRIAPAGAFGAVLDGRIVGTAIGIDYGRFGWIAMMLVEPAVRGRGVGARLLEAALHVLPVANPIRLDATPLGRPLYTRYGFEDETRLTRHVREPGGAPPTSAGAGSFEHVRPVTKAAMTDILSCDREVFGSDRSAVLDWIAEQAPEYAFAGPGGSASPSYCFGRRGRLFDQIGPIVATDEKAAAALLSAATAASGDRATVIDAFDAHSSFRATLRSAGFEPQRPLFRMRRPASEAQPAASSGAPAVHEFAILGPEFA